MTEPPSGHVVAVSRDDAHRFSKPTRESITLIAGLGVDGLMVGPVDEALAGAADALGRPDEARGFREAASVLRDRLAAEAQIFID